MTVRPAWVANVLLAVAACFLAVALSELGVRLFFPQSTGLSLEDPFGLTMHWPRLVRYLPEHGIEVTFNSAGMRDREHAFEKQPGVIRILLLGDSFMEAFQVPFEASLPYLLKRSLERRTGKRVEVVNAGVSGWGTDDELRYLTSYGLKYRPDLVLVAMCLHNDISDNLREEWHTLRNDSLVEQPHARKSFLRYKFVELKAFFATRLQLYQLWRRVRHGREIRQTTRDLKGHVSKLFLDPTPAEIARGFRLTELELGRIQAVATADSSRVALVLLPIQFQLSDQGFAQFVGSAGTTPQAMQIDRPQRKMTLIADSLRIPVVDLLPTFRRWTANGGGALFLNTDGHWNATGHRLAADAVAQGLIAAGVLWSGLRNVGSADLPI